MSGRAAWLRADGEGVTLEVQVVPRASRERIGPAVGERLKVQLTAPPVDGAANEALIALVAKALGVPRRQVRIAAGERGRRKTLRVEGASAEAVMAVVGEARDGGAGEGAS